jgi:putative hydrolase of the HAD superfamily
VAGHPVPTEAIGNALADAYNALHDEELSLFPDAHETLDRLKELGMTLALITNGTAEPSLPRSCVSPSITVSTTSGSRASTASASPRSEPTMMRWKCSAPGRTRPGWSATILNGRSWHPQRLGIYAIWNDGYGVGLPRNSPVRPDRIIRRLSELLP